MPHRFQKVNRIPGKPRDALCQNDVDFASFAVGEHTLELITLDCIGTGNKIICINAGVFPIRVLLD